VKVTPFSFIQLDSLVDKSTWLILDARQQIETLNQEIPVIQGLIGQKKHRSIQLACDIESLSLLSTNQDSFSLLYFNQLFLC